jgi:predicted DCC family thiol-disulfide oxidoreductase YuxK
MDARLRRACARALHVVTPDGRVLRAGRATLAVLEPLGLGPVARLLALPPLVWAVEAGYRIVASNRPFFGRLILRGRPEAPGDRES